jgi:type I restriction enzyme M protein
MAKANQKQSNGSVLNFDTQLGKVIDDAMGAIERENLTIKGVLPCDYARPSLDKVRRGGLVDIISNIGFNESAAKSKDVLGRVCEYFLGKFASAEGKGGGEFYTPQCVVQVLVAMLEPYKGRVFETLQSANASWHNRRMNRRGIESVRGKRWPCASTSGGMFVSSEKFVEELGGRVGETLRSARLNCSNRRKRWPCASTTTWKLARMNLAIRGIDANLGPRNADSMMSSKLVSNLVWKVETTVTIHPRN